jgi:transposase-like protein
MKMNKKISSERKALILEEASQPSCSISELAKAHGVTRGTIYTWIKENKNPQHRKVKVKSLSSALAQNSFVEVALVDNKNHLSSNLQKASLIFNDFSLVIEGNIGATRLLKILKNLEKIC